MKNQAFSCGKCGGQMSKGFIADRSQVSFLKGFWVEGEPINASFLGLKGEDLEVCNRNKFVLRALRCDKCGFVEIYAV